MADDPIMFAPTTGSSAELFNMPEEKFVDKRALNPVTFC
jgi:hypothetical protein